MFTSCNQSQVKGEADVGNSVDVGKYIYDVVIINKYIMAGVWW